GPSPGDLTLRIKRDAVGRGVTPGKPSFPRIGLVGVIEIGRRLGVFAAGDTADQPGAAAKLLVQALEQPRHAVLRGPPPAAENAAVDAGVHVANHIRLHICVPQSLEHLSIALSRRPRETGDPGPVKERLSWAPACPGRRKVNRSGRKTPKSAGKAPAHPVA